MGAREELLAALRRASPGETARPELSHLGLALVDPPAAFAEAVKGVGGTSLRVADLAAASRAIAELPAARDARRVVSMVVGIASRGAAVTPGADPRGLDDVDVAVLPGAFGVAENGAVWLDGAALPHPALFVIAEHLVLIVPASAIVADLHAAYARLSSGPARYGTFIAGPSKTADIEQALVIGAHGAKSCTVVLVG